MSKLISLFTGAGGLDLGFEAAGFDTRVALEIDAEAAATLVTAMADYPDLAQRMETAYRMGGRRWDVKFRAGAEVALPEDARLVEALGALTDPLVDGLELVDRSGDQTGCKVPHILRAVASELAPVRSQQLIDRLLCDVVLKEHL